MPLKKSPSKAAFKQNFLAEVNAGKPQKQALAIAYATKGRSGGKTTTGATKRVDTLRR